MKRPFVTIVLGLLSVVAHGQEVHHLSLIGDLSPHAAAGSVVSLRNKADNCAYLAVVKVTPTRANVHVDEKQKLGVRWLWVYEQSCHGQVQMPANLHVPLSVGAAYQDSDQLPAHYFEPNFN